MIGSRQHVLAYFGTSQIVCKNIDAECMIINDIPTVVVGANALTWKYHSLHVFLHSFTYQTLDVPYCQKNS
jgi:hypothetical protein